MSLSRQHIVQVSVYSSLIWFVVLLLIVLFSTQVALRLNEQTSFIGQFVRMVPWYISWFWFTPLIIFAIQCFVQRKQSLMVLISKHALLFILFLFCYLLSTGAVVFLITGKLVGSASYWQGTLELLLNNQWPYDFTIYFAVVMSAYVLLYLKELKSKEQQNEQLRSELYQSQLNALRGQLNPHFLFNALNTISGLIRMKEVEKATYALSELSYMLRVVLRENTQQLCSLSEELVFTNKYIHFQALRFNDKICFELNVDNAAKEFQIPSLLLYTLVENAVKHGASLASSGNKIVLNCILLNGQLEIKLHNAVDDSQGASGLGIGLINCHNRLQHLYGNDYTLASKRNDQGTYETLLIIPRERKNV